MDECWSSCMVKSEDFIEWHLRITDWILYFKFDKIFTPPYVLKSQCSAGTVYLRGVSVKWPSFYVAERLQNSNCSKSPAATTAALILTLVTAPETKVVSFSDKDFLMNIRYTPKLKFLHAIARPSFYWHNYYSLTHPHLIHYVFLPY